DRSAVQPRAHATGRRRASLGEKPSRDRDTLVVNELIGPGSINAFVHLRELFEWRNRLVRTVHAGLQNFAWPVQFSASYTRPLIVVRKPSSFAYGEIGAVASKIGIVIRILF